MYSHISKNSRPHISYPVFGMVNKPVESESAIIVRGVVKTTRNNSRLFVVFETGTGVGVDRNHP